MKTKTKELFDERNKYKILSAISVENSSLLFDSSLNRSFGKKAPNGSTIIFNRYGSILSPANVSSTLATINTENNAQAINFVAAAFNEMRESLEVKYLRTPESAVGAFRDIAPHKGWVDYASLYRGFLDAVYAKFKDERLSSAKIRNKIVNVETFIEEFSSFQGLLCQQAPFSLSSFIESNACPVHVSGLVIDIADEDCGNDFIKTEKYLNDPNFSSFVDHCAQYGFAVDKNAPWRLYADVSSSHMKRKMAETMGVSTTEDFYTLFYNKPTISDFLALIESYAYIYSKMVKDYPTYSVTKECEKKTTSTVRERENFDITRRTDVFFGESVRGYPFWIRVYIYSKIMEQNLNYNQAQMDSLVKKAISLESTLDIRKALLYTDGELREAEVITASLMKNLRL